MPDGEMIRHSEQSSELTIPELAARMDKLRDVMRSVMREGEDFGSIPGAGKKKVLFQAGGEKLAMLFRYSAAYSIERIDLPGGHREYSATCSLTHIPTGMFAGSATATCSSLEPKYRYRGGSRVCPECGKATIKKSKFPPRGAPQGTEPGFYCYAKLGGCGHEFAPNDPGIVNQSEEKQENPDIAAEFNTVIQMAQKRSFLRAIRMATASSELFTQDVGEGDHTTYDDAPPPPEPPPEKPKPAAKKPPKVEDVYAKARAAIEGAKTESEIIKIGGLLDERAKDGKLNTIQHDELVKLAMDRLWKIRESEAELQQQGKEDPNATI